VIKAVIFDFFGVLAIRGSVSFRKTYFPNDSKKMGQAEKIQDKLNRGSIGYDDFIDGLAKIGGVSREKVLEYTENYQPNTELLNYIHEELKPHYKIGIISNAGADWVLKILGEAHKKLFNDILLSYEVSLIKPESEIYEMSIKRLGVKAGETVFIDDILSYCQGGEVVGMNTIWYKDFQQMKKEFEGILASSNN
jgi:HAD superfamily hydrolase (TIGR01509 family)